MTSPGALPIPIGLAASIAIYLALCVVNGLVWEHSHDEGMTMFQAVADLPLPRDGDPPLPVEELYAHFDSTERTAGDVVESMFTPGGMHPPAYYLALNGWVRVFGSGRLTNRALGYGLGVLSIAGLFLLAERLVPGRQAGPWAALLLALSPWFHAISNFTRPYALASCVLIWATVAVLAVVTAGGRARHVWGAVFVACSAIGLLSIYPFIQSMVWLGALLLVLSWRTAGARGVRTACALGACVLLAYALWIPSLLEHFSKVMGKSWYFSGALLEAEPVQLWRLLLRFVLAEGRAWSPAESMLGMLAVATLPFAVLSFTAARLGRDPVVRTTWLFALLLVPLLAAGDLLRGTSTLLVTKLSFPLFPWLLLLVVRSFASADARGLRVAGLSAWALLLALGNGVAVGTLWKTPSDFEAIAKDLRDFDSPRHLVLVSTDALGYTIPLLLAFEDAGVKRVAFAHATPERLDRIGEEAQRGGFERVSLLDMEIRWRRKAGIVDWPDGAVDAVAARLAGQGWRVRRDPRAVGSTGTSGERVVTVWRGMRAKPFSGPH